MRALNKINAVSLIICLTLMIPVSVSKVAWGHNLYVRAYEHSTIEVKAFFTDGTPGRDMEVVIKHYQNESKSWATCYRGKTDQGGKFNFSPDKPGKYKVVVTGLGGHRGTESINVTDAGVKTPSDQNGVGQISLPIRVFAGLGYIVGLAGFAFGYLSWKSRRRN